MTSRALLGRAKQARNTFPGRANSNWPRGRITPPASAGLSRRPVSFVLQLSIGFVLQQHRRIFRCPAQITDLLTVTYRIGHYFARSTCRRQVL